MRDDAPESQKQRLYRLVFENARDATIIFDSEGRVLLLNRAARQLPEELVERLVDGAQPRAKELARFREELRLQGRAYAEVNAGGQVIALDGKTHGDQHIVTLRDVTERRKMELELRALQRVESIGHLTASIVHDFNNLLTPIACLSAHLERQLGDDASHGEVVRDIREAAERAAALARQVLSYARREPSRTERVNAASAVSELRALLERVVGEDVTLDLAADADAGDVEVDRERLEHVLINLAVNARDAMPTGGRLAVRVGGVSFLDDAGAPAGAAPGSYVVITVTDTGVGMTSEVRERAFERFFSTKGPGQGSGLGLASARKFAAESRGCITVRSEPGRGAAVALYLPRVADEDERPSARVRAVSDSSVRGSETLLVVDDEELVRSAMHAVLVDRGYHVLVAGSADEALELVERFEGDIHLAVIDVMMPGMRGHELATRIQALRPTRVLLTSGHTDRALERQGVTPDEHLLRKAFTPAELLRKVRTALDGGAPERSCG